MRLAASQAVTLGVLTAAAGAGARAIAKAVLAVSDYS
jgi:hypothetical protein